MTYNDPAKLAYTIAEAVTATSIGRTRIYALIKEGRVQAVKSGNRTLIPARSLVSLVDGLPAYSPRVAA